MPPPENTIQSDANAFIKAPEILHAMLFYTPISDIIRLRYVLKNTADDDMKRRAAWFDQQKLWQALLIRDFGEAIVQKFDDHIRLYKQVEPVSKADQYRVEHDQISQEELYYRHTVNSLSLQINQLGYLLGVYRNLESNSEFNGTMALNDEESARLSTMHENLTQWHQLSRAEQWNQAGTYYQAHKLHIDYLSHAPFNATKWLSSLTLALANDCTELAESLVFALSENLTDQERSTIVSMVIQHATRNQNWRVYNALLTKRAMSRFLHHSKLDDAISYTVVMNRDSKTADYYQILKEERSTESPYVFANPRVEGKDLFHHITSLASKTTSFESQQQILQDATAVTRTQNGKEKPCALRRYLSTSLFHEKNYFIYMLEDRAEILRIFDEQKKTPENANRSDDIMLKNAVSTVTHTGEGKRASELRAFLEKHGKLGFRMAYERYHATPVQDHSYLLKSHLINDRAVALHIIFLLEKRQALSSTPLPGDEQALLVHANQFIACESLFDRSAHKKVIKALEASDEARVRQESEAERNAEVDAIFAKYSIKKDVQPSHSASSSSALTQAPSTSSQSVRSVAHAGTQTTAILVPRPSRADAATQTIAIPAAAPPVTPQPLAQPLSHAHADAPPPMVQTLPHTHTQVNTRLYTGSGSAAAVITGACVGFVLRFGFHAATRMAIPAAALSVVGVLALTVAAYQYASYQAQHTRKPVRILRGDTTVALTNILDLTSSLKTPVTIVR